MDTGDCLEPLDARPRGRRGARERREHPGLEVELRELELREQ
jgi:hypothetical protein